MSGSAPCRRASVAAVASVIDPFRWTWSSTLGSDAMSRCDARTTIGSSLGAAPARCPQCGCREITGQRHENWNDLPVRGAIGTHGESMRPRSGPAPRRAHGESVVQTRHHGVRPFAALLAGALTISVAWPVAAGAPEAVTIVSDVTFVEGGPNIGSFTTSGDAADSGDDLPGRLVRGHRHPVRRRPGRSRHRPAAGPQDVHVRRRLGHVRPSRCRSRRISTPASRPSAGS